MSEPQPPSSPVSGAANPSVPPEPGATRPPVRRRLHEEEPLTKGPPSYGKLILVGLSVLLIIPLGIGGIEFFPSCDGDATNLAEVYGEPIDQSLLIYQLVREQGFDAGRREEQDQLTDLRRILNRVIAVRVLAHQAAEAGERVTDGELAAFLKDPARNGDFLFLQQDGRFDVEHYTKIVQYGFRLGTGRYEEYKRQELLAARALAKLGPEARGPEVVPGLGATEVWLFHPRTAAGLGSQAPGPGPAVWALVEQAQQAGQVRVNEALFRPKPDKAR